MVAHTDYARSPSRREMLYYVGGAALGLLAAGSCGASAWYTILRRVPNARQDNGFFYFEPVHLDIYTTPLFVREAQCYLVVLSDGIVALTADCVYEDLRVKWQSALFGCPGCGSRYQRDGSRIAGPARRGLDHFWLEIVTPDGTFQTPDDGAPIPFTGATSILIDTKRIIPGDPHP